MSQEIQPPYYLKNIFPNLTSLIDRRREERKRNSRANEVFLQAKGILESDLAQTEEAEEKDISNKVVIFRQTPPVTFTYFDQKASIQIKDHLELGSLNNNIHVTKDVGSIVISIAFDGENIDLFTLREDSRTWQILATPNLKTGLTYSIRDHNNEQMGLDQIESAYQILTFVEQSLQAASKPQ